MSSTFPYYIHLQVTKSEMSLGNPYIWLYLRSGLSFVTTFVQCSHSYIPMIRLRQKYFFFVVTPMWYSLCHQDISFYITNHFGSYRHLEQDNTFMYQVSTNTMLSIALLWGTEYYEIYQRDTQRWYLLPVSRYSR